MTYSVITSKRAASATKLAHTEVACSCGLTWGTTMESQVSIESADHLAWHDREGR